MSGLERFITAKQTELAELERVVQSGSSALEPYGKMRPSFRAALTKDHRRGPLAVIAEFKKVSPSRGVICASLEVEDVAGQYAANGADAMSILTEEKYFQGDMTYIPRVSHCLPDMPLLRKDFIFHPLQVTATLASPASALLLIVRLTPDVTVLRQLREQAEAGGVEAVVEVFDEADLRLARESGAGIIQVNARDLASFHVDKEACLRLARTCRPQEGEVWIAASGMGYREDLEAAAEAGYHAALVGSALMEHGTPGLSLCRLLTRGEA
ncbi:MAG: indole-3-glycerol-phosphate synthase [Mailhella sp.]|nr:indole-3-glycerol-phosphate synthase [Mailhella sp.]